tara:strand:+ start:172 stop:924 length:753 start_codon:yes stop_codon:yes gene_type:complete
MNRYARIGFLGIFLGGCASTPTPLFSASQGTLTESEKIDFPELNVTTTFGLGDTLAAKGYKSYTPAIRVLNEVTVTNRTGSNPRNWVPRGSEGKLSKVVTVLKTGEKIECFDIRVDWEAHWNHWNKPGTSDANPLCKDSSGNFKWQSEYVMDDSRGLGTDFVPFNGEIEEFTEVNLNSPTYIQEFIYNGRVDNELKFVYREFSGDYIKPAFTQEVQYDLNQSDIIGFKGLRIKILSATNTEIKYTLENNF